MIRVSAKSFRPKTGVTEQKSELQSGRPLNPNRIAEKGNSEWGLGGGLGVSTENPHLSDGFLFGGGSGFSGMRQATLWLA